MNVCHPASKANRVGEGAVSFSWMAKVVRVALAVGVLMRAASAAAEVSFLRDIGPVLIERCLRCHDETTAKGAYRLDTFEALLKPGDSGHRPIVPGNADASHLFSLLVTKDADDRMPQKSEALSLGVMELFRQWIQDGARFDGGNPTQSLAEMIAPVPFPLPPDRYRHPVPVSALTWLPNGLLATSGFREILLWTVDGTLSRRLSGVPERFYALVPFAGPASGSPTSLFFAGGVPGRSGAAGRVSLDVSGAVTVFHRAPDCLLALAVSSDGSRVAVGGIERAISIYETTGFKRVGVCLGHSDWILDLDFSADGLRLASASRDRTARVFDVRDGSLMAAFREHKDAVTTVRFLPGTNRVATGSREGRIRVWDPGTGKQVGASESLGAEAQRLRVRDGLLVSAWSDGKWREYGLEKLERVRELATGSEELLGLGLSADFGKIAVSGSDGGVEVWDAAAAKRLSAFVARP